MPTVKTNISLTQGCVNNDHYEVIFNEKNISNRILYSNKRHHQTDKLIRKDDHL